MDNMVQITTDSGYACSIDREALDDMRIMDALIDLQNGTKMEQVTALRTIIDRMLGEKQKELLYKHLEDKEGRAGMGMVQRELLYIFTKIGKTGKK